MTDVNQTDDLGNDVAMTTDSTASLANSFGRGQVYNLLNNLFVLPIVANIFLQRWKQKLLRREKRKLQQQNFGEINSRYLETIMPHSDEAFNESCPELLNYRAVSFVKNSYYCE